MIPIIKLDKKEKIQLLKAISDGKVDRESLNPETLVATKRGDAFLSLMMKSGNPELNVVLIGEAQKAMDYINDIEVQNEHERN